MAGDDADQPEEIAEAGPSDGDGPDQPATAARTGGSPVRTAIVAGLVAIVALAALTGWLGVRAHQSAQTAEQRARFLQVGREGALALTVFDYDHVDAQVQHTLDLATGSFYDEFNRRAPAFTELVKQIKSKSQGTVSEAGVESQTATTAQLLVAVLVTSQVTGQPDPQPKLFRMRLSMADVDGTAKISDVEFVS